MTKYLLAAALALGFGSVALPSDFDSVTKIRVKYAKAKVDVLKIAEPIKVTRVFGWKDGGTIGIEITDALDRKHLFSLDGRFPNSPGATRNLFVGAEHPNKPGARKVEIRGLEESALYCVLLRWAIKHPQRDALFDPTIDLNEQTFEDGYYIREFFLKLDARFTKQ